MKKLLATLAGGLLIGAVAASYAELPPPTQEEKAAKAAKAEKDAAEKAKAAKELSAAQDKAVANYRKNKGASKGASAGGSTAAPQPEQSAAQPPQASGADHSAPNPPAQDLTRKESQTEMPTPGQANDHSSTGRETVPSGR
jgi:hypothetical protein